MSVSRSLKYFVLLIYFYLLWGFPSFMGRLSISSGHFNKLKCSLTWLDTQWRLNAGMIHKGELLRKLKTASVNCVINQEKTSYHKMQQRTLFNIMFAIFVSQTWTFSTFNFNKTYYFRLHLTYKVRRELQEPRDRSKDEDWELQTTS